MTRERTDGRNTEWHCPRCGGTGIVEIVYKVWIACNFCQPRRAERASVPDDGRSQTYGAIWTRAKRAKLLAALEGGK